MSSDYTPIACALHDEYEIAVMHRQPLHLCWKEVDGSRGEADVLPVDIEVKNGEEFLVVKLKQADAVKHIRLDRIVSHK